MKKRILISFVIILVLSLLCLGNLSTNKFEVVGSSMYPTITDKTVGYYQSIFYKIERFDIVVAKHDNTEIIKRVIGLPNETIRITNNVIFINDVELKEQYIIDNCYNGSPSYQLPSDSVCNKQITLKDDEYLLLGDNRRVSLDSRYYGPFNKEQILGKVLFSYGLNENGDIKFTKLERY